MKTIRKEENLKGMKLEELVVYPIDGGNYIILTKLAEALRLEKTVLYNATARLPQEIRNSYIKTIKINGTNPKRKDMNKCIEITGLEFVFEKMQNQLPKSKAELVLQYLDDKVSMSNNIGCENITSDTIEPERKSNVVNFTPSNCVEVSFESNDDLSSDAHSDVSNQIPSDATSDGSIDNIFGVLNGITAILEEHKSLKQRVPELESEITRVKAENDELKQKLATLGANPDELEKLKSENDSLRKQLAHSVKANKDIMEKANLIKKYVLSNR